MQSWLRFLMKSVAAVAIVLMSFFAALTVYNYFDIPKLNDNQTILIGLELPCVSHICMMPSLSWGLVDASLTLRNISLRQRVDMKRRTFITLLGVATATLPCGQVFAKHARNIQVKPSS